MLINLFEVNFFVLVHVLSTEGVSYLGFNFKVKQMSL